MTTNNTVSPFQVRVGFLGNPNSAEPFKFWKVAPWSDANLLRLKDLGFNTIQVNVAWGPRPDDEPLNLEDAAERAADLAAPGLGMFALSPLTGQSPLPPWTEAADALRLLDDDSAAFLDTCLKVVEGQAEKGLHSVTSR